MLLRNPAAKAKPPRSVLKEVGVFNAEQARRFLEGAPSHRLHDADWYTHRSQKRVAGLLAADEVGSATTAITSPQAFRCDAFGARRPPPDRDGPSTARQHGDDDGHLQSRHPDAATGLR